MRLLWSRGANAGEMIGGSPRSPSMRLDTKTKLPFSGSASGPDGGE